MKEIWKPIPGFEGLYEASNLGRIQSLTRDVLCKNGVTKRFNGKIIVPCMSNTGYLTVQLCKNGKAVRYLIHRLVAMAFLPTDDTSQEVNHIDGTKSNNQLNNLEWVCRDKNIRHAMNMGLIRNSGESNPAAKIKERQALEIKELLRTYIHPKEIAEVVGVQEGTIIDLQKGRTWSHISVTGQWTETRKEAGLVSRISFDVSRVTRPAL